MPELPDVSVYRDAMAARMRGQQLLAIRFRSPFVLRSVSPRVDEIVPSTIVEVRRIAKQLVIELANDAAVIIHLMIAGRLHWRAAGARIAGKMDLAAFDCGNGTLVFTEAAQKKRASIHLVQGKQALAAFDAGGLDVMSATPGTFRERLKTTNHTLKRALTDQRLFSGIGNAYSDEILHRARLSPFRQVKSLSDAEIDEFHRVIQSVMQEWIDRLTAEAGEKFPEKVTAFRKEMAVHGKYREPCPVCGHPVQRIVFAENEANYCAQCQTGGKLLADRALSRLLKENWPKTLDELEARE